MADQVTTDNTNQRAKQAGFFVLAAVIAMIGYNQYHRSKTEEATTETPKQPAAGIKLADIAAEVDRQMQRNPQPTEAPKSVAAKVNNAISTPTDELAKIRLDADKDELKRVLAGLQRPFITPKEWPKRANAGKDGGTMAAKAGQGAQEFNVSPGTTATAVLLSELSSDAMGPFKATLAAPLYSGDTLIAPVGSTVIGEIKGLQTVNRAIASRARLTLSYIIRPDSNGKADENPISITGAKAVSGSGVGAVPGDTTDYHIGPRLLGVGLAALVSVPSYLLDGPGSSFGSQQQAFRELGQGSRQVGRQVANDFINLVPTVPLSPGTPITIFITKPTKATAWTEQASPDNPR